MTTPHYDVLGIGNAIVDVIARADDDFLVRQAMQKGAMSLIDEIVAWDADAIDAIANSHRRADHPLRSDERLRSVHLCEYGAQAMAIHGGLIARASPL